MRRIVVLDSGPLGQLANPFYSPDNARCNHWLQALLANRVLVILPEIADYEVRRELIRANRTRSIRRLDNFKRILKYEPITTAAMLRAAEYWAQVRNQGTPTADDKALDGDVILAAQAAGLAPLGDELIIATTNPKHLTLFVDAREWAQIAI